MSVTVVLPHQPRPCPDTRPAKDDVDFLNQACVKETSNDIESWAGTWHGLKETDGVLPSADGFVRGAFEAWGRHLHFVIRPEEVWVTILVQINFYMKRHAEEIRHLFVR